MTSKLPHIGTTIFTTMSHLANEHKAINLAQGFPDFGCSEKLIELVHKYMKQGYNQYAPMPGVKALREKISSKTLELYGTTYNSETEITITCGATEACYSAITALVRSGDEVIIFEPAFDVYVPAIDLCGGVPIYIEMDFPHFNIDWNKVREKVNSRTRLIIINSPQNPTGSVLSSKDLSELSDIVKDKDLYILSDEVYEHIIFDGIEHASILTRPELRDKALITSSFGKTFHTTGWRMGYCMAAEPIMKEFRKVHQYNTFSAPTPMQFAIAEFLDDKSEYLNLPQFYQEKRDAFVSMIEKSRFEVIPSKGTYFQLLSYKKISEENDRDFAIRLTQEHGIASIPISVFYHTQKDNKVLRFCFAKERSTLEKAAEVLCRI